MDETDELLAPEVYAFIRAAAKKLGKPPQWLRPIADEAMHLARRAAKIGNDLAHERPTMPLGWPVEERTPEVDYDDLQPDLSKLLDRG